MKRIYGNTEARLRTYVDKESSPEGCWLWLRSCQPSGYGQIRIDGDTVYAHIAMYELIVGPVPEGKELDHLCHTRSTDCAGGPTCRHRPCVNPEHLEPVLPEENWKRGNSPTRINADKTHCKNGHPYEDGVVGPNGKRVCMLCQRPSGIPAKKLSTNDVREIRRALNDGVSARELGIKYSVTTRNIYSIKTNKIWKDVQ